MTFTVQSLLLTKLAQNLDGYSGEISKMMVLCRTANFQEPGFDQTIGWFVGNEISLTVLE